MTTARPQCRLRLCPGVVLHRRTPRIEGTAQAVLPVVHGFEVGVSMTELAELLHLEVLQIEAAVRFGIRNAHWVRRARKVEQGRGG